MNQFDEARIGRAGLAWLFEPGDRRLRDLLTIHDPATALERLTRLNMRPSSLRAELRDVPSADLWHAARHTLDQTHRAGARVVVPEDDDWPDGLADLATTPHDGGQPAALCLWIRGDLPVAATLRRSVTVTGAHTATAYGEHVASTLGYGLAERGWTVVSGGSYGAEAAGHRGALAAGGVTVAVLASGVDRPHPAGNAALFEQVAQCGLLVSAWPPGTAPNRIRSAVNQRLLAGLSRGSVVVEAAPRTGPLHTLQQAIDLGRPAMVVPGPVTSRMSAACHDALRHHRQVRLVTCAAEVIAEIDAAEPGDPTTPDRTPDTEDLT